MIEPAFALAAAFGVLGFGVHTFIGGRVVARPLLDTPGLPRAARWLAYFCWHIATVVLVTMAASFAWASLDPRGAPLAVLFTGLALVLAALCAWVAAEGRLRILRLPPFLLFVGVSVAGLWGLAT